jgi:hypothetical protein
MPEYLAPGVYVEETSFRSKSIEGVGTSTAGFVGLTATGPAGITPPLLTSFADFERYYGGLNDLAIGGAPARNYVAHAALAFFANGGGRLYVARVPGTEARAAAAETINAPAPPAQPPEAAKRIGLVARFAGGATLAGRPGANFSVRLVQTGLASTKRLALRQPPGTLVKFGDEFAVLGIEPPLFSAGNANAWNALGEDAAVTVLTVAAEVSGPGGVVGEHAGMGFHPRHPRYVGQVLAREPAGAAEALSNPVAVTIGAGVSPFELHAGLLGGRAERVVDLTGGSDGSGAPGSEGFRLALERLAALEDISIVAAPGAASFPDPLPDAVNQLLIGHAEARRAYRIAVLDTPAGLEPNGARAVKSRIDSKYAALYYPWVRVANPLAAEDAGQPALLDLPPSGFVCGIYARNDIQRGVHKAPANETVTGAVGLQRDVRFGEQEVLNPLGINCIRALPNRGIRVWGARTTSSDPEWKYVNVRRYFLYLEASIDRGTQWAVFEPNGERLWANIRDTVEDFLYGEWLNGALLGASPKEAYFVRCDRSTMSQNDLDNGRLVCLVGVAALKPAEFVIFRVGQKTADSRD